MPYGSGCRRSDVVIGAVMAVVLHWASEFVHQLGHAWAARRVGYPMTGIRFWGVLSTSLYPSDELPLPAALHIRRALGGPMASLLLSVAAALLVWALRLSTDCYGCWFCSFPLTAFL